MIFRPLRPELPRRDADRLNDWIEAHSDRTPSVDWPLGMSLNSDGNPVVTFDPAFENFRVYQVPQFSSSQLDFDPCGFNWLEMSSSQAVSFRSMWRGFQGAWIWLQNAGAFPITIPHLDASANNSANKFSCARASNYLLGPGMATLAFHDGTYWNIGDGSSISTLTTPPNGPTSVNTSQTNIDLTTTIVKSFNPTVSTVNINSATPADPTQAQIAVIENGSSTNRLIMVNGGPGTYPFAVPTGQNLPIPSLTAVPILFDPNLGKWIPLWMPIGGTSGSLGTAPPGILNLPTLTTPGKPTSTPDAGTYPFEWNQATETAYAWNGSAWSTVGPARLYSSAGDVTVAATTTTTSILDGTLGKIPGGAALVGSTVEIDIQGKIHCSVDTFQIQVLFGGVVVADTGAVAIQATLAGGTCPFYYRPKLTFTAVGASAAVENQALMQYVLGTGTMVALPVNPPTTTGNTFNSANDQTVDVQVTWTSNDVGNTVTKNLATVYWYP